MERFTKEQKDELAQEVKRGDGDITYFKRVQAVCWRTQGRSIREAARLSGFSVNTVLRLSRNYQKGGLEALRSKYVGSNNRKLSYAAEALYLEKILRVTDKSSFLRVKDLLVLFERISQESYSIDSFRCLLLRHGWRKVVPRPKHSEAADKETCEAVKKLTITSKS
jgi:transposase